MFVCIIVSFCVSCDHVEYLDWHEFNCPIQFKSIDDAYIYIRKNIVFKKGYGYIKLPEETWLTKDGNCVAKTLLFASIVYHQFQKKGYAIIEEGNTARHMKYQIDDKVYFEITGNNFYGYHFDSIGFYIYKNKGAFIAPR
jgi:hypothetical protein